MALAVKEQTNLQQEEFFSSPLIDRDPEVFASINNELKRQQNQIELIASENIVSQAVLDAQGSVMTNKYAEGYPNRRYYGGCEYVDVAENLARDRAKLLFGSEFVNVQPHSGSQANQGVMMALLETGETILGMSLAAGGHLTHGAPPNLSGKWFNAVQYGVSEQDNQIDFRQVETLANQYQPKLIIAGGSAYPRIIDFERFRNISDKVGAFFMVDMAHFAGLVAAGIYPNPFPHAHIVTSTTHKTLRGPRGGLILTNDPNISKKINSAIFPGLQGGPLMHTIAAKAVALGEALNSDFKIYSQNVIDNAKTLAAKLKARGCEIVTGGTDTHLVLVDLRPLELKGNAAEKSLENAAITSNKNAIPFDPEKPTITSGIRFGTPACTTRGFGLAEFNQVGDFIADVFDGLASDPDNNQSVEEFVKQNVISLCQRFPVYPKLSE